MVRHAADAVVGRHQHQHDRGIAAPRRVGETAEQQAGAEDEQQVDVDDGHPVDREPVPVERAEEAAAVGGREIHQDVTEDADHRHGDEHAATSRRLPRPATCPGSGTPRRTMAADEQAECDDARADRASGRGASADTRRCRAIAATISMSGAFDARTSAAVVPRPARASGVRASVSANSVCVRLSMSVGRRRPAHPRLRRNIGECEKPSSPCARSCSSRPRPRPPPRGVSPDIATSCGGRSISCRRR